MKQKLPFYLFLILITVLERPKTSLNLSSSLAPKIDLLLKESQFQGAFLIAKEGRILFQRGYGFANEEYQLPNTTHTVFRIGSITKQFTAVAILQLQESGKLRIDDPIKKYLPDYPQGERITIHHLLSHTAGIPSVTALPHILDIQRQPSTPKQVMEHFKSLPLKFPPGTDCEYSDSGYLILGAIIEAITQKKYEDYLKESIFQPLGMHATYYEHNHLIIPHRASGYVKNKNGGMQHAAYVDMSFPHASGALASTVEDLYKWDRALREGFFLKKESTDALFAIQGSSVQHEIAYGYGFRIGPQNRGMEGCSETILGHFGSIEGFEAAVIRYLDEDLTLILLSNVEKTEVRSLHKKLAQLLRSSWRCCATQ